MGFADRGGSLAGAAVDALAPQVSVAGVPGVLVGSGDLRSPRDERVLDDRGAGDGGSADGSPGELLGLRATQAGRTNRAGTDREPEVGYLYDFG